MLWGRGVALHTGLQWQSRDEPWGPGGGKGQLVSGRGEAGTCCGREAGHGTSSLPYHTHSCLSAVQGWIACSVVCLTADQGWIALTAPPWAGTE